MTSMLLPGLLSDMGRLRVTRRLRRTPLVRRPARAWLRRAVLTDQAERPNDITVLIGVRNRSDHRLVNALRTIRGQTHPTELVHPMVIDYGSDPSEALRTVEVCRQYGAEYLRIEADGAWSRSRCLNVGIRLAATKYLLTSDVDVVFSPRYLADAVATLEEAPLSVVGAPMFDLPEQSTESFRRCAETGDTLDLESWKGQCSRRLDVEFHSSVGMTHTAFYQLIRGYDEYYEGWGAEDRDLMRRLTDIGLSRAPLRSGSFYLHQWHPKFEGAATGEGDPIIRRNHGYLEQHHTILRNDDDWGRIRGLDESADGPALRGESSQAG